MMTDLINPNVRATARQIIPPQSMCPCPLPHLIARRAPDGDMRRAPFS
jgi:hypothetical protein